MQNLSINLVGWVVFYWLAIAAFDPEGFARYWGGLIRLIIIEINK